MNLTCHSERSEESLTSCRKNSRDCRGVVSNGKIAGLVFDIQRFSLHDGPGIRTTVFLKGCSLRCFWCQNPEGLRPAPELQFTKSFCIECGTCFTVCPNHAHLRIDGQHVIDREACRLCGKCVEACPSGALSFTGKEMSVADVLAVVRRDAPYYATSGGGMTLSGGEPFSQPEFVRELLQAGKAAGYHTTVDTALNVPWASIEAALPHLDLVLADVKHMNPDRHREVAGDTNAVILENFNRLTERGVPVIVRVPVIPTVNATAEEIGAIAAFVAGRPNVQYLELLPYHRLGEAKREGLGYQLREPLRHLGNDELQQLARVVAAHNVKVKAPIRTHARPPSTDVQLEGGAPATPSSGRGADNGGRLAGARPSTLRHKLEGGAPATPSRSQPRTGSPELAPPSRSRIEGEGTWSFASRLAAMRATKLRHTQIKREQQGPRDVDDWGQIPLTTETFEFRVQTDHPKGYLLGPRDCGRNFRRFLAACPAYVDRHSSLLGGYYRLFSDFVTGWDPEFHWAHLVPEQRKYGIIHGIDNAQHFLSDVSIGLALGWGGLRKKIAHYRAINTGAEQQAFYDGLDEFVAGIQGWMANHVAAARQQAATESLPAAAANLTAMADFNERLITEPPATFREALQWLAWYQMAKRVYIGGGSLGRLDLILWPYYERDLKAGALTEESAIFDLACFLLKDSHYIQLGGVDEAGRDASNRLSFLFLEAAHRMQIPANLAVMVHDDMDERLLRRAVELLFVDRLGIPRFGGVKGVVEGFVRNGYPLELARQRTQAGCNWYCLPGREYAFSDTIKINFARVLEAALEQLFAAPEPSLDKLWALFEKHLRRAVEVTALGIDWHMEHQHRFYPEFGLSLLCHGPIEKGVDASHGSLEVNNVGVDGAALATVADSFAAIEQRIEREQSVTWSELSFALGQKWWRAGRVRQLLMSVPGFGRGGTLGDAWAVRVTQLFSDLVRERRTPAGCQMTPGIFSWASTIPMGKETGATPDGRGAGEPISFGANPNPGRQRGGPIVTTGLCTAVADAQPGYGNPAPLQLDVDLGAVSDEEGIAKMSALIRAHFQMGGTLINTNVLDRGTVLAACKDPAKYPDLVVRVTGFSAYFASLSDEFRKLVYERVVAMEENI